MLDDEDDALSLEAAEQIVAATERTAAGGHRDCGGRQINRQTLRFDLGRLRDEYALRPVEDNLPTEAQASRRQSDLRQAAVRFKNAIKNMLDDASLLEAAASDHFALLSKTVHGAQSKEGEHATFAVLDQFSEMLSDPEDGQSYAYVRVEQVMVQAHALAVLIEHWCATADAERQDLRPSTSAHQFFADRVAEIYKRHFGKEVTAGLGGSGKEPSPAIRFAEAVFTQIKSPAEPKLTSAQISERWRKRR